MTAALDTRWLRILWAAFLVSLPVTSFPYLPRVLGGASTVRPLAVYALVGLLALVVFKRLWQERLPPALQPWILFTLVVLLSAALALASPAPDLRGVSSLDRMLRSLLTLALGSGFFLSAALVPRAPEDLRFTVRWLLVGFSIALLWASLQSLYVLRPVGGDAFWNAYFDRLNAIHHLFSIRNLQEKRVSGLAYEPSWFAEQLCILVLPWLLSGVIQRVSVFSRRWRGLIVEDGLLLWTTAVLLLTFSRTGLVILFVLLAVTVLAGRGAQEEPHPGWAARLLSGRNFWGRLGVFAVLAAVLGALVFSVGSNNRYFSRLWRFWTDPEAGGSYWAYIAFGQRFIYWGTALDMFEESPLLGVGPGNYALHFEDHLPEIPLYRYPEILDLIVPEQGRTQLVTPKNLFVRVLAENGILGFALFCGFLLVLSGQATLLWLSPDPHARYWGRAAALGILAAVMVAFSTDSFALPNIWVFLGLVSAASAAFPPPVRESSRLQGIGQESGPEAATSP